MATTRPVSSPGTGALRRHALAALPSWALLLAAVAVPQVLLAGDHSPILAIAAGVALLGGWVGLMFVVARQPISWAVGAGIGVLVVSLVHGFGTDDYQEALLLRAGRALDGVSLAEVLAGRDDDIWVRITDARVRSEADAEITFVRGGGRDAKGGVRPTTSTTIALAPVTLAAEVSDEEPMLRRRPSGEVSLWACAPDTWTLRAWDRERQAVRGRLARIDDDVTEALVRELRPDVPVAIAGAGAIPPAPGAAPRAASAVAPSPPRLFVAHEPWCVHLDRALDAATASAKAWESAVALVLSISLFTALGALMMIAILDDPTSRR